MWYIYALYSKDFDRIYVGMSENPERRLENHNNYKVKSTKAYVPWKIIMIQEAGDVENARRLEKYYKAASGRRKIKKTYLKIL